MTAQVTFRVSLPEAAVSAPWRHASNPLSFCAAVRQRCRTARTQVTLGVAAGNEKESRASDRIRFFGLCYRYRATTLLANAGTVTSTRKLNTRNILRRHEPLSGQTHSSPEGEIVHMPRIADQTKLYMAPEVLRATLEECFGYGAQSRFARLSGISRSQVSRYLSGACPIPQYVSVLVQLWLNSQATQSPLARASRQRRRTAALARG
jgi:hypothetical protein